MIMPNFTPNTNTAARPHIVVLGTGGTIAATATNATKLTDYSVTEGIDAMLDVVPGIDALASIECIQAFNVDSRYFTNAMLLELAQRVNALQMQANADGIVITHGTDSLEETAYFLNLTLKSAKPVVVTGAMRPGSAISADGPLNLYNAVFLACCAQAHGQGVLVALNNRVHAARFVQKMHTTQADAFESPDQGCLGQVHDNQLHWHQTPCRAHTVDTDFCLEHLEPLPKVDIIYDHQSAGLHLYQAAIDAGAQGIVVAAMGNGSLSAQAEKGLRLAVSHNIVCVRSSRVGGGTVSHSADDDQYGFVSADSLNPQKARILLMLALAKTRDTAQIQDYFNRY